MIRRKLLTILFICVLLPVLLVLFQSTSAMISQSEATTEMAGSYVRDLARYAAARWNDGNPDRIEAFLSLLADQGYESLLAGVSRRGSRPSRLPGGASFVPGMVAYVTLSGRVVTRSRNASILLTVAEKAINDTGGAVIGADGHLVGTLSTNAAGAKYVAYIAPTDNPRVVAVAAVTMMSWAGQQDFDTARLAIAGTAGMMICLAALLLLRGSVIAPLQALSSTVDTLRWGEEMPPREPRRIGDIRVEEITSLKNAVSSLAARMIEKDELESRYVGDIIKATEDERARIAQDIHDGPIQALSALIQKIQMIMLSPSAPDGEERERLAEAERIGGELVQDLRGICDQLVPPWISLGAASCMEEAAARFERQHCVTITTDIDPCVELPQDATLALFRIFQEAVSNAARHGGASEIHAELRGERGCAVFTVKDDGGGFDKRAITANGLMREGRRGLNGMIRRAESLGGSCEIESRPGERTTKIVRLPAEGGGTA